jgi:hypothetical protein
VVAWDRLLSCLRVARLCWLVGAGAVGWLSLVGWLGGFDDLFSQIETIADFLHDVSNKKGRVGGIQTAS